MLKNYSHKVFFENHGYVKIPLLSDDNIKDLKEVYDRFKDEAEIKDKEFFTSIWSENKSYREAVDSALRKILLPILNNCLEDFKPVFSNLMIKKSGENSKLQPHQDWTFVDETKFDSITVWIPLENVQKINGALEVLPGSHKLKNYKRARFLNSPFADNIDEIQEKLMKSIEMSSGEALFVNSRTIHSSPPNLSSSTRVAISIVVAPKEANLIHYVLNPENKDEIFLLNISPDFFTKYSCFDIPDFGNIKQVEKIFNEKIDFSQLLFIIN